MERKIRLIGSAVVAMTLAVGLPAYGTSETGADTLDVGVTDISEFNAITNANFVGGGFGEGFGSASSMYSDFRGSARSDVQINPSTGNPAVHRNEAILTGATTNTSVDATSIAETFSSELFKYTGTTSTTLQIKFTLTGKLNDPITGSSATDGTNQQTGIGADVGVFTPENFEYFDDFGTLLFEFPTVLESSDGTDAVDTSTLLIDDDTAGQTEMRMVTLSFDVDPGDEFYVVQQMFASAWRGGRDAESFNSLTSEFISGGTDVVNLSVPEPATAALLALGSLLGLRRRRR